MSALNDRPEFVANDKEDDRRLRRWLLVVGGLLATAAAVAFGQWWLGAAVFGLSIVVTIWALLG